MRYLSNKEMKGYYKGKFQGFSKKKFNPEFLNRPRKHNSPEGHTQLQILHYLKSIGATVGKTRTMGVKRGRSYCFDPYTFLGYPDLTFFHKNRLYFCEVKSPQGIQSEYQKSFQELCEKANISYILARSLEDVIKEIT